MMDEHEKRWTNKLAIVTVNFYSYVSTELKLGITFDLAATCKDIRLESLVVTAKVNSVARDIKRVELLQTV